MNEKKKKLMDLFADPRYRPMKLKELAILLDVPKERREELQNVLNELLEEGKITLSRRGKYAQADSRTLQGIFHGTQKRFGFVTVEGEKQDIYIAEENTMGAMHGDQVLLVLTRFQEGDRRPEGKIIRILVREVRTVVGTYEKNRNFGFVTPDQSRIGTDIFIPKGQELGAVTGHKVVARITKYADDSHKPEGEIIEILGHAGDPGIDILSIIRSCDLHVEFPPQVMEQTAKIPETVSEAELAGRLDLRHLPTVTIDGEDAKDLDDAITLTKENGIYHLGVHIADVTHYVTEGSPLDREALCRGTSVYLVDRVIPMLPHRLSNGICSLNAGEDRLALSCLMDVNEQGLVVGHQIAETVIRVDRRMTYTKVNEILKDTFMPCGDNNEILKDTSMPCGDNNETLKDTSMPCGNHNVIPPSLFVMMAELAGRMRRRRKDRGALDFDFPESKIVLDDKGRPVDIHPYERNAATDLIEDFMLAANETIAEDFFWQELPFVYRIHDVPDADRIRQLALLIRGFGYGMKGVKTDIHPKELQKLLVKIQDSPEEMLISRLTLRSLKQARYATECTGHFGLAANYYCHFTSPIRRYPDLQIHRIIKENLHGKLDEARRNHYEAILPDVAKTASTQERKADEAERETIKAKKAEYMAGRIGAGYDGVISGVTAWGMYVELENTVEGLVHVTDMLDDYYLFDETLFEMRGESTGRVFRLGQRVRVVVKEVDLAAKTISFVLQEDLQDVSVT